MTFFFKFMLTVTKSYSLWGTVLFRAETKVKCIVKSIYYMYFQSNSTWNTHLVHKYEIKKKKVTFTLMRNKNEFSTVFVHTVNMHTGLH